MVKMKISTKIDLSGLKKLKRQLETTKVDVGYIDSKDHWMNKGISVAQVANNLHYWSPWKKTFMLDVENKAQVQSIVTKELRKLGMLSVAQVAKCIGSDAKDKIVDNIISVDSPKNSTEWADVKGFNDPLRFGSRTGQEPNLISELTFRVG